MKTIHLDPSPCPYCGNTHDAASPAEGEHAPKPGDISLCISCGEWVVFDEQLRPRKPTEDELIDFATDPKVKRVREAWVALYGKGGPFGTSKVEQERRAMWAAGMPDVPAHQVS